ncbi:TetR-like C-terminal domain-containing protein [Actinomadura sp. WAC 06369]|uniref:TetR-like C-terminal domain-containing protein n=1 Tax=Actinomadura sp. WAC 06369 TaxID=2203193 RepID=UPI000F77D3D4|nr:TetR-like C-terminal domain-containing protein [Actinomadura sp. WAC 06369]RSN69970.1 TetR family transcriptional regulator [Actinomadura sp. WAC 06369]
MMARGRKPDPAVDARIKRAAVELLVAKGPSFTVDEVAAAAGVGRASVFRRYATKRDMLLDAIRAAMDAQVTAVPDTGSLEGDLLVIVSETLAVWNAPEFAERTREMFGEAGRDPAVGEILRTAMRDRMARSRPIYDRAIERGELAADADLWLLSDMVVGLAVYRGLIGVPQPDPSGMVRALLHGFAR